jgi:hypothetical protein
MKSVVGYAPGMLKMTVGCLDKVYNFDILFNYIKKDLLGLWGGLGGRAQVTDAIHKGREICQKIVI